MLGLKPESVLLGLNDPESVLLGLNNGELLLLGLNNGGELKLSKLFGKGPTLFATRLLGCSNGSNGSSSGGLLSSGVWLKIEDDSVFLSFGFDLYNSFIIPRLTVFIASNKSSIIPNSSFTPVNLFTLFEKLIFNNWSTFSSVIIRIWTFITCSSCINNLKA